MKLRILLTGFGILIFLTTLRIVDPYPIEILRLKGLDYYQRKQQKVKSDSIEVVEIDEQSLMQYGQWPFPRNILADGIQKAFENEAQLVVLPILFSEQDRLGGDKAFLDTLQKYPVITSQSASIKGKGTPVPRGVATIGTGINDWIFNYPAAIGPTKEIGESSAGVGMLLTAPELDGVTRRMPLIVQVNKETYPCLPLEVLRMFGGEESFQAKVSDAGVDAVRVKGIAPIKTDSNGRVWINFKYKLDSISFVDKDWSKVKGKIVILALTAEGLNNTVATPIGISQGYEVSAQTLQMLIDGNRLQRPAEFDLYEIGGGVLLAALLIVAACYFSYTVNGVGIIALLCAPFYVGLSLFENGGYLVDYTWPTLAVLVPWVGSIFMRFVMEFKLKQQIKKQFGTYLSKDMVDQLQKDPSLLKLGGETKELTILFSDIRGYTALSEHFGKDVQGLTSLINRYMDTMLPIIMNNKGNVGKLIGDAIMAWWSAPIEVKNQATLAVKTAQEMKVALDKLNKELIAEGIPPLGIGVGINTGEVVVGNMGSKDRFSYDILGDAVNLASRLEGQSKPYGVLIVIGKNTKLRLEKETECLGDAHMKMQILPFLFELDCIAVKGKSEGIKIYTILESPLTENVNEIIKLHDELLSNYRMQRWDNAIQLAKSSITYNPELAHYYQNMIERIDELRNANLPADWDGVFVAKSK